MEVGYRIMNNDNIFEMGATIRHGRLLNYLIKSTFELFEKKELEFFQESAALVYYGEYKEPELLKLVDAADIQDIDDVNYFKEVVMPSLKYVTPDYMYFKDNIFLKNEKETQIAGQPNLIVEVWSEGNTDNDKKFKKYLYSTSPVTEHWYITQDSNLVECYYGQERMNDKSLVDLLVSKDGVEFDLRYLAV
jgi:hypothetical protein